MTNHNHLVFKSIGENKPENLLGDLNYLAASGEKRYRCGYIDPRERITFGEIVHGSVVIY
jgi:hypothetical protein